MPQRILIVDDDPTFRQSLSAVLASAGYAAVEAADGRGALEMLDRLGGVLDLLVVDLCLADDVNGLDVIAAAKRRRPPVKIIAASAVFEQFYLEMAVELGADTAVRKPEGDAAEVWLQLTRELLDVAPPESGRPKVVVLADDEPGIRLFLKAVLEGAGYRVLEAADGAEALATIRQLGGLLDLLVTDCRMPRMDGPELARAVAREYPQVPVLFISGYASGVSAEELNRVTTHCGFLAKPFMPKPFLALVKKLTDDWANDANKLRAVLTSELDEARRRFIESSRNLLDIARDVPSGLPHPDGSASLENAGLERRLAFERYQTARRRLDDYLATEQRQH